MIRKSFLSSAMGLVVTVTVAACGGDAEVEPMDQAAVEEPAAPAAGAPAAGAPAPAMATGDLPAGITAEMVTAGQQIFVGQGLCFTCHGQQAQGTPLAPNLTDDSWLNIQSPEENLHQKVVDLVRTGVSQPLEAPAPMPPMGGAQLTDEQIASVAAYVVSLAS